MANKLWGVCSRKRFKGYVQASAARYSMAVRQNREVFVEPCHVCGGYHLKTK